MQENLINDLLDLAKLRNCKFELHNEPFNLVTAIKNSFDIVHNVANQRNITLRAVIDKESHLGLVQSILGDERRYQQILLNFLSNSLKFTNAGGCVSVLIKILGTQKRQTGQERETIRKTVKEILRDESCKSSSQELNKLISEKSPFFIERQDGEQKDGKDLGTEQFVHLQVTVRDTGIGMAQESLKHLFMDFGKLDDQEGRNKGGTGLGLSICKLIIEQMGGSVVVKSKVGRGTDFQINLKIKSKKTNFTLANAPIFHDYFEDIESAAAEPETKAFVQLIEASSAGV